MKLAFLIPIHPRDGLSEPRVFVQNALRCFFLDQWRDKELWLADSPGDGWDVGAAIHAAKRATRKRGITNVPVHYFRAASPLVGVKRNEMIRRADADVYVCRDDDDLWRAGYGTTLARYLLANPRCPGSRRCHAHVYNVWNRTFGEFMVQGAANHAWRAKAWDARNLRYAPVKAGEDTALKTRLKRRHPYMYNGAFVPALGQFLTVIRLDTGHLTSHILGKITRRLKNVRGDPDCSWLMRQVPPELRDYYRALTAEYRRPLKGALR